MENLNYACCESLSLEDACSIVGGGFAYDIGHMVGSFARDAAALLLLKKLA